MARDTLQGRVAIVTGAGMGMGEATAILFAQCGAKLVVADIDVTAGTRTATTIRNAGGEAIFERTDVSDEASVAAMVAAAVDTYGRIDCAVNNAAIEPDNAPIEDADLAVFDRVIAVNLRSVLACMKHEIRQFLKQGGGGAIVNVGSVSSIRPQPGNAAYVAAKHGVIGLTKTGSLENAGRGIRVNAVLPGGIETPMMQSALVRLNMTEADFAPALSLFNRFGRPEEVAEASLWLCSDASSFVTGHSLAVDAGYTTR